MSRFANDHERALELCGKSFFETISESERGWLDNHLAECQECSVQLQQTHAAVSALRTVSISAGDHLVSATQKRVRALCLRQEARKRRMRPIWISSAFASIWIACSAPYLWQSFNLTGHWLHIPDLLWQMAFLVVWFTPALTGAAVAFWLRPMLTQTSRAESDRRAFAFRFQP